jgi:hypothetical protein
MRLIPYLVIDKHNLTQLHHFQDALSLAQFVSGMTTGNIGRLIIIKFEIRIAAQVNSRINKCRNDAGAFSVSALADYFHSL